MKQPEDVRREVVAEWLRKADADMELAEHLLHGESFPNAIAFSSQQAAEKYLKALLSWRQVVFPKTHDLDEILNLVETTDPDLAQSLRDIVVLSPYGVELRYPGDRPDATWQDAEEAVQLADKVRAGIMDRLTTHL